MALAGPFPINLLKRARVDAQGRDVSQTFPFVSVMSM